MSEQKKRKPKPVSVTFNPHNSEIIVLCDDASLWAREFVRQEIQGRTVDSWKWVPFDEFDPE